MVLGSTLDTAAFRRFLITPPVAFNKNAKEGWGISPLVFGWSRETGWCVNDIERLIETQSMPIMIYPPSLRRREVISSI